MISDQDHSTSDQRSHKHIPEIQKYCACNFTYNVQLKACTLNVSYISVC